jgi:hypothetical protein
MGNTFVTLEIGKLLKELGFNEPCLACNTFYSDENHFEVLSDYYNISNQLRGLKFVTNELFDNIKEKELSGELFVLRNATALPTWDDAKIWIEDKFELFISVVPFIVTTGDKTGHRYTFDVIDLNNYYNSGCEDETLLGFLTYNEAREQAFLKTLKYAKRKQ